ncbi:MAG: aminopeptidase, partial [Clostridia bacterium]|nr:aminopeptidase [Clostridia bacterium]
MTATTKTTNKTENKTQFKNKWSLCTENDKKTIFKFCEGYKEFLSNNKTERECLTTTVALAEKNGFKNLETLVKNKTKLKAGDRVYSINKDKTIAMFVIGTEDIENGMNIIGAHIDSPRLDLKATPLYEKNGFCLLDTHYYGGIKTYQWVTMPLAMHGVVVKKDGSVIKINIGEKEDDPVFYISDLLPHLRKDKTTQEVSGEQLDVLIANMAFKDENNKEVCINNIKEILKSQNIEVDDFISAEIEIVPSGKAKDMGLDRSMVVGYGHDDRSCA